MQQSTIRYIADLHLYDPAVAKWHKSPNERLTHLIANWNNMVSPDDITFILGDVGINCKITWETIKALHGHKILVVGNHDNIEFWPKSALDLFDGIHQYILSNDTLLIHKPKDRFNYDNYTWVLHGHLHTYGGEVLAGDHDDYIKDNNRFNCAADMINLCPQKIQGLMYHKSVYVDTYKDKPKTSKEDV